LRPTANKDTPLGAKVSGIGRYTSLEFRLRESDSNSDPIKTIAQASHARRVSPLIFLAVGALVGGLVAIWMFGPGNPHNYWASVVGWIAGGLVYRARSMNWESDPRAKRKRLALIAYIGILSVAVMIQAFPDREKLATAFALFGGCSFGILIAGCKRKPVNQV